MTNSWAFLYDELYPDGEMKESKPFQSNQFEVEKQRAMSNIKDVTNSQEDWEDFWYNSESEGKDVPEENVEEDNTPKTFLMMVGFLRKCLVFNPNNSMRKMANHFWVNLNSFT